MRFCRYFSIQCYKFNLHIFKLNNLKVVYVCSFYCLTKSYHKHVYMTGGSIVILLVCHLLLSLGSLGFLDS